MIMDRFYIPVPTGTDTFLSCAPATSDGVGSDRREQTPPINIATLHRISFTPSTRSPALNCDINQMRELLIRAVLRNGARSHFVGLKSGLAVQINPQILIQEIGVAPREPEWVMDLVMRVVERYGLSTRVRPSDLTAR